MPSADSNLVQVLARADYANHLPWGDRLPPAVKKAAMAAFPQAEPPEVLTEMSVKMEGTPQGQAVKQEQRTLTQWSFHNAEQTAHLRLATNFTLLVFDRFKSYPDLRRRLEPVWAAIADKSSDLQVRRLGLRYVYNIPRPPDSADGRDWAGAVEDNVSFILRVPDPRSRLARTVGVAEYNLESCMLRFQFGMHNPDFPALLRQSDFLLDYDGYLETALEPEEVLHSLDLFNKEIRRLVRASTNPGARRPSSAKPKSARL